MRRTPIVAGIALFVVAAAITFYFLRDGEEMQAINIFTAATMSESMQSRVVSPGAKEYRNTAYRFSLLYPETLTVKEYIEKGNALTITFQDAKRGEGFQLFIVPYSEPQISEERFKRDAPSGVRTGLTDMTIDGATGAAFYSENTTLGETKEIWFIRGGFLFEVTTLKPLESWLDDILLTWQFL